MTINFNDITDTATPTSGTFNTGGNSNVKGAGQNLLLQSQTFSTYWTTSATTLTSSQTDPLGGSTAFKLIASATTAQHFLFQFLQSANAINGATYTVSIYAKSAGYNYLFLQNGNSGQGTYFNLSTGTIVSNGTGITSTIINAGNGWYRCSITTTLVLASLLVNVFPSPDGTSNNYTGDGTSGIYIWGSQAEFGTITNTYTPTTTTVAYNTPQLTFSGVANIGLQSDGALFVQPAGTGALQAQKTDSATTGGNARGAYAADFQTQRGSAARVASGTNAFMGAGYDNAASGSYSVANGGYSNTSSGFASTVSGGRSNIGSNDYSVVSGGYTNTASGQYSAVIGGYNNTSAGLYNFIGGGQTNSGTANAAVTTQSATMNGTTAVTLSGSNASIKVGQIIFGTSISSGVTYVAAISGTSLTLSQNATGSTTNTLSFYTPHGVVVGGGNNQATGSYSFIGGGGDAGSAASRNAASGDWSFVGGGKGNISSAVGSFIGGGGVQTGFAAGNTASGEGSFIGGGLGNNVTTSGASVVGGYQNTASGIMSGVVSGRRGATRGITGNIVLPACNVPIFDAAGVSQAALLVLGKETTNATATVLTSDGGAGSTVNQVILPNNAAYYFTGTCIANVTGAAAGAAWSFEGAIMRGANAGSTVLIGTPVLNRVAVSSGASLWAVALTADTSNGGLAVTVTGVASTTIRWVAKIETTEVTY